MENVNVWNEPGAEELFLNANNFLNLSVMNELHQYVSPDSSEILCIMWRNWKAYNAISISWAAVKKNQNLKTPGVQFIPEPMQLALLMLSKETSIQMSEGSSSSQLYFWY